MDRLSKNGYLSIVHLFEQAGAHENHQKGYKLFLNKLVAKLYTDSQDSIFDLAEFRRFHLMFDDNTVDMESVCEYLCGIQRRNNMDDHLYCLEFEKCVWEVLKATEEELTSNIVQCCKEDIFFQLFCLFNRFCEPDEIPMKISFSATMFLAKHFKASRGPTVSHEALTFPEFLNFVCSPYRKQCCDRILAKAVKKTYDMFVRDILMEGREVYQVRTCSGKRSSKITTKNLISLSSLYLKVYKDDPNANPEALYQIEPPLNDVLLSIPMSDVTIEYESKKKGESILNIIQISSGDGNVGVDLIFDTNDFFDNKNFVEWKKTLEEAKVNARCKTNRLLKTKCVIGTQNDLFSSKSSSEWLQLGSLVQHLVPA